MDNNEKVRVIKLENDTIGGKTAIVRSTSNNINDVANDVVAFLQGNKEITFAKFLFNEIAVQVSNEYEPKDVMYEFLMLQEISSLNPEKLAAKQEDIHREAAQLKEVIKEEFKNRYFGPSAPTELGEGEEAKVL